MIIKHESKTTGKIYIIDTIKLTCTCPNYIYVKAKVGGICKHIEEELKKLTINRDEALKFLETENDAIKFITNFSEELLEVLKVSGEVYEKLGKIYRI